MISKTNTNCKNPSRQETYSQFDTLPVEHQSESFMWRGFKAKQSKTKHYYTGYTRIPRMGIFDWLIRKFRESEETNNLNATISQTAPVSFMMQLQNKSIQQFQQNRDFLYGLLFGSFKTDFDAIKNKLGSIHTDLSENHSIILGQTDKKHNELIGLLGEHREQLGQFIEKAEQHLKQANLPKTISKDLRENLKAAKLSLRQAEIYEIAQGSKLITAKQIAKQLKIAENTATEHLRKLEKNGFLNRKKRGVYTMKEL